MNQVSSSLLLSPEVSIMYAQLPVDGVRIMPVLISLLHVKASHAWTVLSTLFNTCTQCVPLN